MCSYQECFREFNHAKLADVFYIDTSFIASALINGQYCHNEALGFIESLAKAQPVIVFSEILKAELRCAVLTTCLRNEFGKDVKIMTKLRDDPELIKKHYPEVEKQEKNFFGILQRFTNWLSIPMDEKTTAKAAPLMQQCRLGSYDAIHVATMDEWKIKDIIVFDSALEDLPMYRANSYVWTVNGWNRYKIRHGIR